MYVNYKRQEEILTKNCLLFKLTCTPFRSQEIVDIILLR